MEATTADRHTFATEDEAVEVFHERRWTDGLPIVLPTEERVAAMIAGSGRRGSEIIAEVWTEYTLACGVGRLFSSSLSKGLARS